MASNIDYLSIDETYPVSGVDNSSQGFRDNFSVIKDNFSAAKVEIEDLQSSTAKVNANNNFLSNEISNATLVGVSDKVYNLPIITTGTPEINFDNGSYHVLTIGADITFILSGWAGIINGERRMSKMRVEMYGDGGSEVTAGSFVIGQAYTINSVGTTTWTAIGAPNNTVGTTFIATGAGSGTGTAQLNRIPTFTAAAGGNIKYSDNWPSLLALTSASEPKIFEFWSWNGGSVVYANYLGSYA